MATFFYFLIFIITILVVMAIRLKPQGWITILMLSLFAVSVNVPKHIYLLSITWIILLAVILITLSKKLRCALVTKPIFNKLKTTLPKMSSTEKQAIEAGNTWWEKYLFSGTPNFDFFKNISHPQLTKEEQAFLEGPAEDLCSLLNDWNITEKAHDLPKEVWQFLKEKKFFGLLIEKKWGGLQFSAFAHSTIVMKIATRSLSAAVTVMVPNSLGPGELISRYGTEEQKEYYLPRLASGLEIPCFALTSPEAGSDATALIDEGIVCKARIEGVEKLCIRLNWNKRYITLAPIATLIGLAFKLHDPDQLLGKEKMLGITLALVPAKHPGIEIGKRHKPMHMAFMNGPIQGKDVLIPIEWIIGGSAQIGKGWEMMMECLSAGRGISLPALSTGNAKMAFCMTGAYAYLRKQFDLSIGKFEGVQEALGRIGGMAYLCEAVRLFTTSAVDTGINPGLASAITKYHITELGRQIGNDAFDIHAGRAIQRGPRNYLANIYDAIPISITVEGANILTRSLIIFGQGAIRCHPYLQREMEAIERNAIYEFDTLLFDHTGYFLKNLSRAILLNSGGYKMIKVPFEGKARGYAKKLIRMSLSLALISDIAFMVFGGLLKRKESLSARLGDVLSYLYMASALLKQMETQKENTQEHEVFFQWGMDFCFYQAQIAFENFFNNLNSRILKYVLKILVFPLGRSYSAPSDELHKEMSDLMMQDGYLRKFMQKNCYVKEIESDPTSRVELAFKSCIKTQPLTDKIKNAVKKGIIQRHDPLELQLTEALKANILTPSEVTLIKNAEKKRLDSLEVDEF